jgi:hypothetical protein
MKEDRRIATQRCQVNLASQDEVLDLNTKLSETEKEITKTQSVGVPSCTRETTIQVPT